MVYYSDISNLHFPQKHFQWVYPVMQGALSFPANKEGWLSPDNL